MIDKNQAGDRPPSLPASPFSLLCAFAPLRQEPSSTQLPREAQAGTPGSCDGDESHGESALQWPMSAQEDAGHA